MTKVEAELIYVGDPLCSWCWGAAPEITALAQHNQSHLSLRVLLGGLKPYTNHPMSDKQRQFLRKHWQEINALSGQDFAYDILKDKSFIYNTEPPARAVYTIRQIDAKLEFEFFKAIQKSFYAESKNTNTLETYLGLCDDFFIEREEFLEIFNQNHTKEATAEEFEQSRMLGVMGFPTILLRVGEKHKALARGYETFDTMQARLEHFWKKLQT